MAVDKDRSGPARRQVMAPDAPRDKPRPGDTVKGPLGCGRETVESIVVAFTLALLFRAFEAEAFVIPTGSMAPTLMGRHKDLACTACSRNFRVGCSAEEDDQSQSLRTEQSRLEREVEGLRIRLADTATPPAAGWRCSRATAARSPSSACGSRARWCRPRSAPTAAM